MWSTGARARNFVAGLGPITEELDMRPEAVRMEALRYVVHFIGDIHQPLHTFGEARGGNDIPVTFDVRGTVCRSKVERRGRVETRAKEAE